MSERRSDSQRHPIPTDNHPDAKGTVWLDPGRSADIPEHSAADTVGECAGTDEEECEEVVVIASQSLRFIASAANLPLHEALLCDAHLNEKLSGLTLDLSIGDGHTRSEEFEERREERKGSFS